MRRGLIGIAVLVACAAAILFTMPAPQFHAALRGSAAIRVTLRQNGVVVDGHHNRGDVWITLPDGAERQLTRDAGAKHDPQLSPDQTRIAYVAEETRAGTDEAVRESLHVIDLRGDLLFQNSFLDFTARPSCSGLAGFYWIDRRRVAVMCALDPYNNDYMVMDVDAGKLVARYKLSCCDASWSPDGKTLAHLGYAPYKPGRQEQQNNRLEFDAKEVFPAAALRRRGLRHTFLTGFAWSPDSTRVAFVDFIEPGERQLLIIAGADRRPVLADLPVELAEDDTPRITWDNATTVRFTLDDDYWTLDATSGEWDMPPADLTTARLISPAEVTALTAIPPISLHR